MRLEPAINVDADETVLTEVEFVIETQLVAAEVTILQAKIDVRRDRGADARDELPGEPTAGDEIATAATAVKRYLRILVPLFLSEQNAQKTADMQREISTPI